jgi:predicted flap endonuclease-1-like 5' DNA nuclease
MAAASETLVPEEGKASDLHALPGAGSGLVWMLEQCGIRSMADLSGADAADLAARMGLVGQMLDLDAWIAFAARVTATSDTDTDPDMDKDRDGDRE